MKPQIPSAAAAVFAAAAVLSQTAAAEPPSGPAGAGAETRGVLGGVGGASVSGPRVDSVQPPIDAGPAPEDRAAPTPDQRGADPVLSPAPVQGGASTSPAPGAGAATGAGMEAGVTRFGAPPPEYPPCRNRAQDRCRVGRR